jgi:hypothetical protein
MNRALRKQDGPFEHISLKFEIRLFVLKVKHMGKSNKIVAAVDVGTTKVVVVAAERMKMVKIELLGVGKARSMGVSGGDPQH